MTTYLPTFPLTEVGTTQLKLVITFVVVVVIIVLVLPINPHQTLLEFHWVVVYSGWLVGGMQSEEVEMCLVGVVIICKYRKSGRTRQAPNYCLVVLTCCKNIAELSYLSLTWSIICNNTQLVFKHIIQVWGRAGIVKKGSTWSLLSLLGGWIPYHVLATQVTIDIHFAGHFFYTNSYRNIQVLSIIYTG